MLLEACVETFDEAYLAWQRGANRIELCSHLELDGLTPSPDLIRQTCTELPIPVMVMIRPRAGNFVHSEEEVRLMEEEIAMAKELGASGIVFGLLTGENNIDVINTARLARAANPLPVTFHKAIDVIPDPVDGVRQLLKVPGITRILTSGGKPTARDGVPVICEMIRIAGKQITILVAGRVTGDNVYEIAALTGSREFHGRRVV
jgi:copper homeostasis protein